MKSKLNWIKENEAVGANGVRYYLEPVENRAAAEPHYNITKHYNKATHYYHSDLYGANAGAPRLSLSRAEARQACEQDYAQSRAPGQIEWFIRQRPAHRGRCVGGEYYVIRFQPSGTRRIPDL